MRISIGNTPLDSYNEGPDFDKAFARFEESYTETKAELNRAVSYEIGLKEEESLFALVGGEAGILSGLGKSAGKVKNVVGKATTSVGHKVIQALNWLAESMGSMWDSLMKYDKKYKDLPKKIKEASEKLQTGSVGEMAKYSFYDIDVDALKKAVAFLDFNTFMDVKIGGLAIGGIFKPDVISKAFDEGSSNSESQLKNFLSSATKLKKTLEDVGQEGVIYQVFSMKRFRDIKSDYKGDGDKDGMIDRFTATIIGDKVEIEGPDFVTACARYFSIVNKLAGDKLVLKNLKKSADELKQLTKRLSSVIKRASSPVSSYANKKQAEARDEKDAKINNKRDELDKDDSMSDRDKAKEAEQAGEKFKEEEDKYKDIKDEITACVTVIGSVITNTYMTTTKATLSVYKKILDDAYTAMSYVHSL